MAVGKVIEASSVLVAGIRKLLVQEYIDGNAYHKLPTVNPSEIGLMTNPRKNFVGKHVFWITDEYGRR